MKGIGLFFALTIMCCLAYTASAAPAMKVKMAESFVKTAEGGGFTAKTAAKEARQRVDELKKTYGADDPDVQALEKRLEAIEGKEKAAKEEKAAQEKAEQERLAAEKKAKEEEAAKAKNVATIAHKAAKPWVLDVEYEGWNDKNPIKKYVKNLGKEKKEDVLELDKQLRARIAEDRQIVEADGDGKEEAEMEISRYEDFLYALEDPVRMNFNGNIDMEKKQLNFDSFQILLSNFSTKVMRNKKDGKFYFFGANGEPEYIREKELPFAQEAHNCMYYVNVFCANQPKEAFTQIQSKAAVCAMYTNQALKNNSPDVVIFHPVHEFPKGEMHSSALAKEALQRALPVLPNAVDVIINSNDWSIERNGLGIIIRRVCVGWVVVKDDLGKQVIPAKWFQPNQGGDSYGKLDLLNYGGNRRFYIQ